MKILKVLVLYMVRCYIFIISLASGKDSQTLFCSFVHCKVCIPIPELGRCGYEECLNNHSLPSLRGCPTKFAR